MLDKKIILASASPRRQELMKIITENFDIIPANVDESIDENLKLSPEEIATNLAVKKAFSIDENEKIVIGCDTIVALNGKILGKPVNRNEAFAMLSALSGKVHFVITGVCLKCGKKSLSFTESTKVTFYELSEEEIHSYLNRNEYKDKAGSYGIQGFGSLFVKEICGDYFNVVGLPVGKLNKKLAAFTRFIN